MCDGWGPAPAPVNLISTWVRPPLSVSVAVPLIPELFWAVICSVCGCPCAAAAAVTPTSAITRPHTIANTLLRRRTMSFSLALITSTAAAEYAAHVDPSTTCADDTFARASLQRPHRCRAHP